MSARVLCLRLLDDGPATIPEMCDILQANKKTIGSAMADARRAGEVHVTAWVRNTRGLMSPVFARGPGVDAQKPKPFTKRQRNQRCDKRRGKLRLVRQRVKRGNAPAIPLWLAPLAA